MKLLTTHNTKLERGEALGYDSYILHLAPANSSGFGNVCPGSTPACRALCLGRTSGRMRMPQTRAAQDYRTWLWFHRRSQFLEMLYGDIAAGIRRSEKRGQVPVFRLNGTSDIRWEKHGILDDFRGIQFYDYTKLRNRRGLPPNYHLTFSLSERDRRGPAGMPWTLVVSDKSKYRRYWGRPCVDGDAHDLTFLHPDKSVILLTPKGSVAKRDTSGFVDRR
jgi:hypothetical protein